MTKKEEKMVRVKVLRGFQNYEVGSIVEIDKSRFIQLEARRMVEACGKEKLTQPKANRSVGLEKSEKKAAKREG